MKWISSRWASYLSYGIVIFFFGVCAFAFRADLAKMPLTALASATEAMVLMLGLSLLNVFLRAWRWKILLRQLGHDLPAAYVGLTYVAGFAFTLAPGKVGELLRATYYRQRGIPFVDVATVFFVERLADLAVIGLLAMCFLVSGLSGGYGTVVVVGGLALLVCIALVIAIRNHHLERFSDLWGAQPGRLGGAVQSMIRGLVSAKLLLTPRMVGGGLLLGFVAWGAEGVGLYALSTLALDLELSVGAAVGIYAMAILAGALTFLPGGLGTAEATMAALLVHQGSAVADALLITLICRVLTLWLAIGLGWLAVGVLRLGRVHA